MNADATSVPELNASQRSHLRAYCQQADKLLGDVQGILTSAASKTPFRKYVRPKPRRKAASCKATSPAAFASALARNYPGMLTESDPPAQRGRG